MGIELHGDELHNPLRNRLMSGQLVKEIAKEQEVERKAKAIGGTAAGADMQRIGGSEPEEPTQLLRRPVAEQWKKAPPQSPEPGSADSADPGSGDWGGAVGFVVIVIAPSSRRRKGRACGQCGMSAKLP
jgi:hypothetical protein